MKSVSIMEAQHNLSRVLKSVERGETIAITRHKKEIAELSPPKLASPIVFPDFARRARETWGGDWRGTSSQNLLDETRGEQ
jgi:antitoxin (DNA-binding transcriptional repressor) of toxin-antitoxin stability system